MTVPLCVRLARGIELTPYGAALARRARAMLLELREVDREISDLKIRQGRRGLSRRGHRAGDRACRAGDPAHPQELSAHRDQRADRTSGVLARELLASRHDFIIARIPDDLNPRLFERRVIGIEKACLIVRRGHPLADGAPSSSNS